MPKAAQVCPGGSTGTAARRCENTGFMTRQVLPRVADDRQAADDVTARASAAVERAAQSVALCAASSAAPPTFLAALPTSLAALAMALFFATSLALDWLNR